jgi:hypothetical protein
MAGEPKIELIVNGKSIEMNEFVQKITGNLVLAILNSIRIDEEPKTATINLKIS